MKTKKELLLEALIEEKIKQKNKVVVDRNIPQKLLLTIGVFLNTFLLIFIFVAFDGIGEFLPIGIIANIVLYFLYNIWSNSKQ
jgi:hypothetical protein